MGWLRRQRLLGWVDAIHVHVHRAGRRVGRRTVQPGRVAVTFEDGTGWVIVDADIDSMAGMLRRTLAEVEELRVQRKATWDRVHALAAEQQRVHQLSIGAGE